MIILEIFNLLYIDVFPLHVKTLSKKKRILDLQDEVIIREVIDF